MSKISVIVPIYYGEKYIQDIILQMENCKSCLSRNDFLEVLFVNDAPDAPIALQWKSKAVHIVVMNTDQNLGIHGTRVKGLMQCSGDYVLFLDQDDVIKPEYFYSQIKAIGESDAVICKAIHNKKKLYTGKNNFENVISREFMLGKWNPIMSPGQVLLRKQAIPGIWIENILSYNGADDWFLWLCMIAEERSFSLNPDILYEHIMHCQNASDNIVNMLQSKQEVIQIIYRKNIFSGMDFELLMNGIFQRNIYDMQELYTARMKLNIFNKWLIWKEQKISFSEQLFQAGIHTIAIYGCGMLGDRLYDELYTDMDVKYFIDKNADEMQRDIPVYILQENLPKVDVIIITLIDQAKIVEKKIMEILHIKTIILKDWIIMGKL